MTAMRLAPAIKARRALVFLDEYPSAARFAHALRVCGFEVRTVEGDDPYPVLAGFLSGAQPGELLVIRWPSGSGWVPSAFTRLIMDFGRRLGDSSAAALLLVVDFGWVLGAVEPGQAQLNVPGDPPVAAAALTASLAAKTDRPGSAASLTGVLADRLLAGGEVMTVADLFAHACEHFSLVGSELTPVLFSHGEIGDIPVSAGRRSGSEPALAVAAQRLADCDEPHVPTSAAEIAARVYDLYLSEGARTLMRRAALLPGAVTAELAAVLGAPDDALAELEAWGLAGAPHPVVRELGLSRLDPAEAGQISSLLRRHHAVARAVRPRTRLTPDSWTLDDRLGHRVYAEAIAAFIRHPDTLPPLTIGIKGRWGAGKTSLMRMVQDLLDPGVTGPNPIRLRLRRGAEGAVTHGELLDRLDAPVQAPQSSAPPADSGWRPTVWFNPWMYQNGEQVWAGLAHEIINQVTDRLPRAERERFWLELNLARVDREAVRRRLYWLATTRLAPVALGLLTTGLLTVASLALEDLLPGLEGTAAAVASAGSLGSIAAGAMRLTRFFSEAAEGAFGCLIRPPDPLGRALTPDPMLPEDGYRERTGFLHLVQTDMQRVLDLVATQDRPLVVFVDDLDRCSSGTVAKVIEAVNLFLAGEFPNCVFVVAMEPEVVAAHVEMAYRGLVDAMPDDGSAKLGWRFLEKIVQLPLSVPLLDDEERLPAYIRALLALPVAAAPVPVVPSAPMARGRRRPLASVFSRPGARQVAVEPAPAAPDLVDRLETVIRGFSPTIDSLDEASHRAQLALGVATAAGKLAESTRQAADRVFDDLYSDENAYAAIESTLHAVTLRNPREVKRYLNVFRFYSFVTYRRHLAGLGKTTDEAVAKLSALTIGWPHLLAVLTQEAHPGVTVLDRLESAAQRSDGDTWQRALQEAGLNTEEPLRQLLATRPAIAPLARALL